MTVLKQIDERVSRLLLHGSSIFSMKDELFQLLQTASGQGGQLTADESRHGYKLAREINELYRAWYSEAWYLVSSNLPERIQEFDQLYSVATLHLVDLMDKDGNLSRATMVLFEKSFSAQVGFVRSIPGAIAAKALGLRGLLARDLMDDELSAARHLLDNGYTREAGIVAGVVLERHLKSLCDKHAVAVGPRDSLGQLNDKFRTHYPDDAEYRRVQFLNEIRASCAHDKSVILEASKMSQLISGVQGFIATVT